MIARTWHGRVRTADADAYYAFLRRPGLVDYQATPGNRGVFVFRRTEGDMTHFVLTTLWDSIEAIRRLAALRHPPRGAACRDASRRRLAPILRFPQVEKQR